MKKYVYTFLLPLVCLSSAHAQVIITVAGFGVEGYHGDGGLANKCQVHWPEAVALDDSDNLYIADANNNVIRKVRGLTGIITTVAGTGAEAGSGLGGYSGDGGPATAADMNYPSGVAVDATGNIFIADQRNNRIRKVDVTTGKISTIAGTGAIGFLGDGAAATAAALYHPTRVALDASGNVFIADSGNNRIRVIDGSGNIHTIAGNGTQGSTGDGGPAINAELFNPIDMVADGSDNVYIADYVNNRIRRIDAGTGNISTYAGIGIPGYSGDGGQATNANIYEPSGLVLDAAGNLYFSDLANSRVRKIDPAGIITTVAGDGLAGYAGDGGAATAAKVWFPEGLAIDARGQLYIADKANDRVREVSKVLQVNEVSAPAAISIYPNPAGSQVIITSSVTIRSFSISNMLGQVVMQRTCSSQKEYADVSDLLPGIYFLRVNDTEVRRFLKQ